MNFATVTIVDGGGGLKAKNGGLEIEVPAAQASAFAARGPPD